MAAAADLRRVAEDEMRNCDLFRCFCCWRRRCSPGIPRIGPCSEYLCIPAGGADERLSRQRRRAFGGGGSSSRRREQFRVSTGAASATVDDDYPRWSVLVGCTSAGHPLHNLRLHSFRVTISGRVVGHNNDLLKSFSFFSPVDDEDARTVFPVAKAATTWDDRALCIICTHRLQTESRITSGEKGTKEVMYPKAFILDTADKCRTLKPLPFTRGSFEVISAFGMFWVPVVLMRMSSNGVTWRLIVYKLLDRNNGWAEVTSVDFPYKHSSESGYNGSLLQGYAVVSEKFILLSFSNSTFFLFECSSGKLTNVN